MPPPDASLREYYEKNTRLFLHLSGARSLARDEGFVYRGDRDLTPDLHLHRLRDRLIAWGVVPLKPLLWRWAYFRGLIGGHALQQCLAAGLIRYRCLVFERTGTQ